MNGPIYYSPTSTEVNKTMVLTIELDNIFNQTTAIESREAFLDEKQNWPEPLVFAGYLYISMMTYYETDNAIASLGIFDSLQFDYEISKGNDENSMCSS
jgi:hypothetical protein